MAREFTITDGQLGTTAATLLAGTSAPPGNRVDIMLRNTGTAEETIQLTLSVGGGTARNLPQIVLDEDESAIIHGLAIQAGDTLTAVTTNASVVDYVVSASARSGFSIEVLDYKGTGKGVSTLRQILAGIEDMVGSDLPDVE